MHARRIIKNASAEAEQFRRRAALAFIGVVLALGGLAFWYFRLQVWQYQDYATRSEANRIKLTPVVPGRGLIFDAQGRVLADNVPAYRLEVVPEDAGDPDVWLPQLRQIIDLSPEDIENFRETRKVTRGFRPIALKLRVGPEEIARFAVDRWRFPGIELVPYLNRRYPYGELFSHVIGYVGRVDAEDLKTLDEADSALTHIGKTGLERSYEEALRGEIGYAKVETNVEGRAMGVVGRVPATPGADLKLSIDLDLQRAMVRAFGDQDGSAVAVDPDTGQILAMVSLPGFDTNLFVNGISHANYNALLNNPSRPLFNRNVLGGGPPGSTVKPFVGLAGLDSGLREADDRILSTGVFHIPGFSRGYRDSHSGGHGWVDLRESISQSVNTYYYDLALDMGIELFSKYMHRYGFGEQTGIDLVGETDGVVPSKDYKRTVSTEPFYPGETVIAGIGQGYWIATALQLARATAAIANDGVMHELRLVQARRDGYQAPWVPLPPTSTSRITSNPEHLQAVQEGMIATVHGSHGTARGIEAGAPYLMAGKTGTAQRSSRDGKVGRDLHSLPYNLRHTALFVGYAPADNPEIAVAVVVEHGGYGSAAAAPIARAVFDAYLLGKMPEPLPPDLRHRGPISDVLAKAIEKRAQERAEENSESDGSDDADEADAARSPSPPGVKTRGLRATGARAAERPRRWRGPGREAGVGVRAGRNGETTSRGTQAQRPRPQSRQPSSGEPSSAPRPEASRGQALRARTSATSVSPTLRAADAVQIGDPADLSPEGRREQQQPKP